MLLILDKEQAQKALMKLKERLENGGIRSVTNANGAMYCTYFSPSGTKIEYMLFMRAGQTILSIEVQSINTEVVCDDDNNKLFDLVKRSMERVWKHPSKEDALASFLSHTT